MAPGSLDSSEHQRRYGEDRARRQAGNGRDMARRASLLPARHHLRHLVDAGLRRATHQERANRQRGRRFAVSQSHHGGRRGGDDRHTVEREVHARYRRGIPGPGISWAGSEHRGSQAKVPGVFGCNPPVLGGRLAHLQGRVRRCRRPAGNSQADSETAAGDDCR